MPESPIATHVKRIRELDPAPSDAETIDQLTKDRAWLNEKLRQAEERIRELTTKANEYEVLLAHTLDVLQQASHASPYAGDLAIKIFEAFKRHNAPRNTV